MRDHAVGFSSCETEPFLSPGSIQPHGYLLTLNPVNGCLWQLSTNCQGLLGGDVDALLGKRLHEVLPELSAALWPEGRMDALQRCQQRVILNEQGTPKSFWALVHQHDGVVVLELEPCFLDDANLLTELRTARELMAKLYALDSVQAIAETLVRGLRAWSGFEQVVLYRFVDNGSGQVLAEDREAALPSYQGLFFPASDVPYQVRAHASRKTIRMLVDANAVPVPLQPTHNPHTGALLDQAHCELRTPHYWGAQYYRNMGVGAVLSLSMVHQGRLLGYVCFHHREPRLVDFERRTQMAQLVEQATHWLRYQEEQLREKRYLQRRSLLDRWLGHLASSHDGFAPEALALTPTLLEVGGFAVGARGSWQTVGDTPPSGFLDELSTWLAERLAPDYLHHRLVDDYPPAAAVLHCAAGLVALSPGQTCKDWLLWFRPEYQAEVAWAGNPEKAVQQVTSGEVQLTPRDSFQRWQQQVDGESRAFDRVDRQIFTDLQEALEEYQGWKFPDTTWLRGGTSIYRPRLDKLLGSLNDALRYLVIADMSPTYVSPPIEAISGYRPHAFIIQGDLWRQIIHPRDRERVVNLFAGLGPGSVYHLQYTIVHADGSLRQVEDRGEVVDSDKEGLRIESILRDVTESHRLAEGLEQARVEADLANQAKSRFLASMSHEIRTPMNAIIGFAQILTQQLGDDERYQSYLRGINTGANNLLELLNNVLDFSRIEAERLVLHPLPTHIGELLAELQSLFQLSASRKGLSLIIDTSAAPASRVQLDGPRLRQILINLVGNAVKFTEQGQITVSCGYTTSATDPETIDLYLSVSDTGLGVPEAKQEQIFQAFEQGAAAHNRSDSSGLGLAISRHLARLMGGDISLESSSQGSCFRLTLIAQPVVQDAVLAQPEAEPSYVAFQAATVLVADDDPANRAVIRGYLAGQPLSVQTVSDGQQLLDRLVQQLPSLILLDLQMPGMDGFQVLEHLAAEPRWREIPVIIITATLLTPEVQQRLGHASGFLAKPFSAVALLKLLASFLPHSKVEALEVQPRTDTVPLPQPLRTILENRLMPQFEALQGHFSLTKMHDFAKTLSALSDEYPGTPLAPYTEALTANVEGRRIGEIRRLLKRFPQLLEQV